MPYLELYAAGGTGVLGSGYYKWDSSYATCHDAEDATGWGGSGVTNFSIGQLWNSGPDRYQIYRAALYCSRGGLTGISANSIVGAYIKYYPYESNIEASEDFDLTIISCVGIPLSTRAASDYGALGDNETDFGHMDTDEIDIGEWNEITLNGDGVQYLRNWRTDHPGRGWIWIGLRSSEDIDEDAPTANGDYNKYMGFYCTVTYPFYLYIWYLGGTCWATDAVRSDEATSITTTTATINGTLVDAGGETCQCGFMWGTTVDCSDETTDSDAVEESGTFSHGLTGLTPGTEYYFKTYATNSQGTCYGDVLSFRAPLAFPTDNMARVSAIRRIFRPGLYRMELSLGDLGFDWDVAEIAMKKTTEGVTEEPTEPEEIKEKKVPTKEEVEEAARKFREESWPRAVELTEQMFGGERPAWAGKWTAPAPGAPNIPGLPVTPLKRFTVTFPDGRTVNVVAKNSVEAAQLAGVPLHQMAMVNIKET